MSIVHLYGYDTRLLLVDGDRELEIRAPLTFHPTGTVTLDLDRIARAIDEADEAFSVKPRWRARRS